MNYLAYTFSTPDDDALKDMFVELLGQIGFDGFMDADDGLQPTAAKTTYRKYL